MKYGIALVALAIATPVAAKPIYVSCVLSDGPLKDVPLHISADEDAGKIVWTIDNPKGSMTLTTRGTFEQTRIDWTDLDLDDIMHDVVFGGLSGRYEINRTNLKFKYQGTKIGSDILTDPNAVVDLTGECKIAKPLKRAI